MSASRARGSIGRHLRRSLSRLDRLLDRRELSLDQFIRCLRGLGAVPGATIYIHSSMDEISRRVPNLDAGRTVDLLKELVGEEGTLLMPTFPFSGYQYDYAKGLPVFDAQRSVSLVGILTEVFRRSEGVVRSLHPTHSVAAWGRHSRELTEYHHLGSAFGENCPVYRMQEFGGRVVGLGVVPHRCFTPFHVAEQLHPKSRAEQYSQETFSLRVLNGGQELACAVTPLRADRIRRYDLAARYLKQEGVLHDQRVMGLRISTALVRRFLQRSYELIEADLYYS